MTESEKIKFYINKFETIEAETKKETSKSKSKKSNYEIELASGLDFIIKKNRANKEIKFIYMPSQNQYLIQIDKEFFELSMENLKNFFAQLGTESININTTTVNKLDRYDICNFYSFINDYKIEINKGLISFEIYKNSMILNAYNELSEKLKRALVKHTPILSNTIKYGKIFIMLCYIFNEVYGYDIAKKFMIEYTKSSMCDFDIRYNVFNVCSDFEKAIRHIHFDPTRLIQYFCYDLYMQGYVRIPIKKYVEYINYGLQCRKEKLNKYPNALETDYDIMFVEYEEKKEIFERESFENIYHDFKRHFELELSFEENDIQIIFPESIKEIKNEGTALHHCVGSYISKITSGECIIVFARKVDNPKIPYLTVELIPEFKGGMINYRISQIQGAASRTQLNQNEIEFFLKLMDRTGFESSNFNLKVA